MFCTFFKKGRFCSLHPSLCGPTVLFEFFHLPPLSSFLSGLSLMGVLATECVGNTGKGWNCLGRLGLQFTQEKGTNRCNIVNACASFQIWRDRKWLPCNTQRLISIRLPLAVRTHKSSATYHDNTHGFGYPSSTYGTWRSIHFTIGYFRNTLTYTE